MGIGYWVRMGITVPGHTYINYIFFFNDISQFQHDKIMNRLKITTINMI